jgi:predicted Zn-dependent peptidase
MFSGILGGGMSSRLFQEVREKRGLVYTIASFVTLYSDSGLLGIYAGAAADKGSEIMPVICHEIAALGESVTEDELSRARAQARAGLLMSQDSAPSRCEQLGTQMLVYGRPLPLDEIIERIDAVDRKAISRIAMRLLATAPTFVTLGPKGTDLPIDVATLLN